MNYLILFAALLLVGAGCTGGTPRFTIPEASPSAQAPEAEAQEEAELSQEQLDEIKALADRLNQQQQQPRMYDAFPGVLPDEDRLNQIATIKTVKGDMVIELFGETAPKAVSNFITLAKDGYFDGLTFHRRVEGFVIQGGDPSGNGSGGPGYTFEDELNDPYSYERGIVAMANRGPNTNGSQFFIMLANNPLPKQYTIFGRVLSGMEAVDAIAIGDVMTEVTIDSTRK